MTAERPFTSAIIVAAGSGTRCGGVAQPLIPLYKGKTVFSYVLEAFAACGTVDEIVVVCKDSSRFEPLLGGIPAVFAPGGSTRAASVYSGVRAGSGQARFVCIHDCARPFIAPEDIRQVCEKAYKTGAAAACSPMRDTVKYSEPEKKVLFTPAREHLIAVATPQVFRKELYLAAYAAAQGGPEATDETTICERIGVPVAYVPLDSNNMKLTTAYDVKLAKAVCFLAESERKEREKG